LMGWIVVVFVLALVNFFIGMNSLKGFLASHSAISSSQDLEEFKGMVRQQMYQALLQLGLLGLTVVLGLYGIVSGRYIPPFEGRGDVFDVALSPSAVWGCASMG